MIDMQRKPEPKPQTGTMLCGCGPEEKPLYPEDLCIELETEDLEKLGISPTSLPAVGTVMQLVSMVRVKEVCSEPMQDGSVSSCVELQIEQMELNMGPAPSIAERMYGRNR